MKKPLRRFVCYYHPHSRAGVPVPMESGELPSVVVDAPDAATAAKQAAKQVGHPVTETVRIGEDVKPAPKPRKRRQAKPDFAALGIVTADKLK